SHRLPHPPRPPLSPYTTLFRSRASTHAAITLSCGQSWPFSSIQPRRSSVRSGVNSPRSLIHSWVSTVSQPSPCDQASTLTEVMRSEEHTSELQSRENLVCRLLL